MSPYFNPRTREGCDVGDDDDDRCDEIISIHAPVKGATAADHLAGLAVHHISIHAPVKGATAELARRLGIPVISIHAPVKGATWGQITFTGITGDFNPRTREGCDVQGRAEAAHDFVISIHAPVKGATR